ncbi:hypothetical protein DK389_22955 [Methylobacterium durans]|uniref:3',5'-cyclic-nucleotide phosphodiesterase n=1 Tax=Methylobacterium durans TaxID=2202825 RepID=A0A2U8WBY8_9HYPH|nr:hypothetical protein [Methylobacterium durans]AWN42836.1 hypothetical protein DK389_22955 [Methylobacterium durans]
MKTFCACLRLSALTASTPALGQGTPEQRQACTPDAMNLCGDYIPDAARVKACLLSQRQRLSPACRAAIGGNEVKPRKRRRKNA